MSVGMVDEFHHFENKAIIKVCGIGGGGGNAVGRMIEAGMKDVEFITINTDAQALRKSPAGTRLQIGPAGLGAGARPDVAREAAEEARDRIAATLTGADMIFLTAGLGGGTGTGATPVVAELARETGALTVAIVTLPFTFESPQRMKNAIAGLEAMQDHVDAAIVVPNDRLSVLCQSNITFVNAFKQADEVLHNGVRAISELITVTGLINLDFADVRTIMHDSGRALMGIGSAEGENRAVRAAGEAIVCPLLENSTIEGATRVIVNVQGGTDIGMREVHDAVTTVQKAADPNANIIFGAVVDDDKRDEVRVTVIAAGFANRSVMPGDVSTSTILPFGMARRPEPEAAPEQRPVEIESPKPQREEARTGEPVALEPRRAGGKPEQIMIPEEEQEPVIEAPAVNDEDMSLPAFLRKRMRRT
jgi:cell division protein FtsZ